MLLCKGKSATELLTKFVKSRECTLNSNLIPFHAISVDTSR